VTLGQHVIVVPVPARYTKAASSISIAASLGYVVGSGGAETPVGPVNHRRRISYSSSAIVVPVVTVIVLGGVPRIVVVE
jgi:hypothetical protein